MPMPASWSLLNRKTSRFQCIPEHTIQSVQFRFQFPFMYFLFKQFYNTCIWQHKKSKVFICFCLPLLCLAYCYVWHTYGLCSVLWITFKIRFQGRKKFLQLFCSNISPMGLALLFTVIISWNWVGADFSALWGQLHLHFKVKANKPNVVLCPSTLLHKLENL